jgi:uridine phosphorylase
MITDSYDNDRTPLLTPQDTLSDTVKQAAEQASLDTVLLVFSNRLIQKLQERNEIEELSPQVLLGDASARHPVFRVRGTDIGILLSGIGGPSAAGNAEELRVLFPLKNLFLFGSCGTLTDLKEGSLIVPEKAYRDEGTSYHYAPASDYIDIPQAETLRGIFDQLEIPHVSGNTWTTDAFYRETAAKRDCLVNEGCVCVEMECASVQAVCTYYGINFFPFFYSADSLHSTWTRRILGDKEQSASLAAFHAAVSAAEILQERMHSSGSE